MSRLTINTATPEQLLAYQAWLCAENARLVVAFDAAYTAAMRNPQSARVIKKLDVASVQLDLLGVAMDELWRVKRGMAAAATAGGAA